MFRWTTRYSPCLSLKPKLRQTRSDLGEYLVTVMHKCPLSTFKGVCINEADFLNFLCKQRFCKLLYVPNRNVECDSLFVPGCMYRDRRVFHAAPTRTGSEI